MDRIEKNLPGLSVYAIPDEKTVKQYIRDLNPIKVQNNVIFVVLTLFCIVANLVSIDQRSEILPVYRTTMQVE